MAKTILGLDLGTNSIMERVSKNGIGQKKTKAIHNLLTSKSKVKIMPDTVANIEKIV